jgi:hypothetical protein
VKSASSRFNHQKVNISDWHYVHAFSDYRIDVDAAQKRLGMGSNIKTLDEILGSHSTSNHRLQWKQTCMQRE